MPRPHTTSLPADHGYDHAAAITPHDTNELATWAEAIYVGVAGDIRLTTWGGEDVTLGNVPVGILPIRAKIVDTDTTALELVALWR